MEFLKRNIFLASVVVVLLISSIALGMVIKNLHGEVKKYEEEVKLIIESEKNFANSPHALTAANVKQTEANYQIAAESFRGLITRLNEKYPPPDVKADMTALKFKNFLRQVCIRLENLLRSGDIWIPDALKYFTYDKYMRPDVLPSANEIELIMKQLEIVQEIMYLISQSQVSKLLEFKRLNDLTTIKRDLYDYMPFSLVLTGNVESIRRFINSLAEAKYFMMVRSLKLKASPAKQNTRPANKADTVVTKNDRLVYSDQMTDMTATIVLDYFTFHDKE